MKQIAVALISTFLFTNLIAQNTYVIKYERAVNLHKSLPKGKEMLKALIPEFAKQQIILKITNNKAMLTEKSEQQKTGGATISVGGSDAITLFNYDTKTIKELHTFNNHHYYTENPFKSKELKKISGTKTIQGYKCQAVESVTENGEKLKIWYTKELTINASPLPPMVINGTILEVESEKLSYTLISIEKKTVDIDESKFTKAMKITEEQLRDLQEEEMEKIGGKTMTITM